MEFWFEAVPSPAGASAKRIARDVARLTAIRDAGATRILVPEVADTGHDTVDPIHFAAQAAKATGLPVGVAIITATRTPDEVAERLATADRAGVDTMLIVGRSRKQGPATTSVTQALHQNAERHLGVITIPGRVADGISEADRLLRKRNAGARFAVSQILFDEQEALTLRRTYCAMDPDPIPVYYSLAPVCHAHDLEFLISLGVDIPEAAAARIRASGDEAIALQESLAVARRLVEGHTGLGECGFVVSHVMAHNVPAAVRLLEALRQSLDPITA